jgi:death-on-curing protein
VTEPIWIDRRDALALHQSLLARHGGAGGVREEKLLESALARPRQKYAYEDAPDLADLAAAYTAGIVRNHPFVDGNRRTGFVVGVLFLEINGVVFTASEANAARAVLDLAAGTLDETAFAMFLRDNIKRPRRSRSRKRT